MVQTYDGTNMQANNIGKCDAIIRSSGQWRNVAPVAPASPEGAMRRGRQNFELKLFGCKNVPYVGQINFQWWGKIFGGGTKSSRGRQKASGGAKKLQGAQKAYKKNRKNSGDLFIYFFSFFF